MFCLKMAAILRLRQLELNERIRPARMYRVVNDLTDPMYKYEDGEFKQKFRFSKESVLYLEDYFLKDIPTGRDSEENEVVDSSPCLCHEFFPICL